MQLRVIAVGRRMPAWVEAGVAQYAARLPRDLGFELVEIAPGQRTKNSDPARAMADEGERMLAQVPEHAHVVALDEHGTPWTTRQLAAALDAWRLDARPVALLVGGPDGLAPACLTSAAHRWSLSALTLPHGLVRVVLAEQLYRAWSLINNHPYHRD